MLNTIEKGIPIDPVVHTQLRSDSRYRRTDKQFIQGMDYLNSEHKNNLRDPETLFVVASHGGLIREFICNKAVLATENGLPVEQYIRKHKPQIKPLKDPTGLEQASRDIYISYMCFDILSMITQCLEIDEETSLEQIVSQYLPILYMNIGVNNFGTIYEKLKDINYGENTVPKRILDKFKQKLELFYNKLNEIKGDRRFNDDKGRPHKPEKNATPNGCCALLKYNFDNWYDEIFPQGSFKDRFFEKNDKNILNKHRLRGTWELNKEEWYRWCYENISVEGYYYDSWPELTDQGLDLTKHGDVDIPGYNRDNTKPDIIDKISNNEHTNDDISKWYNEPGREERYAAYKKERINRLTADLKEQIELKEFFELDDKTHPQYELFNEKLQETINNIKKIESELSILKNL